ncbi:hypothetical protein [Protaetiibacter mangrovi]|uniref:Thioredoxin domain-containing protein n=1 Tax=Protaetiibacter mangrovi TaxID=2970926 RepID=A0ABT1ZDL4_9MICO|nr:hypothetical protein [Protaetiibacter mangrovi]MCS0498781.1 hypothetical protein [Protaetiibacter mangrovi]TPX04519.1 hypothetical protein FJ656_11450 [Schumannella luteola]
MPNDIVLPARGTAFPALDLVDADGHVAPLSELIGGRRAVVHFMRSPSCPVCLGHGAVLQRMRSAGEIPDVPIVFVAPGGADAAAEAQARLAGRGIVVRASDDAHPALGLGRFLALQHSGTFVLDADGAVLSAVSAAIPTASFSRAATIDALRD